MCIQVLSLRKSSSLLWVGFHLAFQLMASNILSWKEVTDMWYILDRDLFLCLWLCGCFPARALANPVWAVPLHGCGVSTWRSVCGATRAGHYAPKVPVRLLLRPTRAHASYAPVHSHPALVPGCSVCIQTNSCQADFPNCGKFTQCPCCVARVHLSLSFSLLSSPSSSLPSHVWCLEFLLFHATRLLVIVSCRSWQWTAVYFHRLAQCWDNCLSLIFVFQLTHFLCCDMFTLQVLGLVGVRHFMRYLFTEQELEILDDKMPELLKRKKQDARRKKVEEEQTQRERDLEVREQCHATQVVHCSTMLSIWNLVITLALSCICQSAWVLPDAGQESWFCCQGCIIVQHEWKGVGKIRVGRIRVIPESVS